MTIRTEKRDLFTVPQGWYLAHCISADFALGAGIAKTFDEVYDMRYKLHLHFPDYTYEGGDSLMVDNVFNLVTKERCFHKPTYESLAAALTTMRRQIESFDIQKLAMPRIASGLDRLEWTQVLDVIEETLGDLDIEILVCEL